MTSKRRKAAPSSIVRRFLSRLFAFIFGLCLPGLALGRAGVPRRVVALAPNLTEIVFALGEGPRLVGVSAASDFPSPARKIPSVGGATPDLERIVALHPDLVLAATDGNSGRTVGTLRRLGVPVFVTSTPDLPAVAISIEQIAARLGVPQRGKRLADSLRARLQAVTRAIAGHPRPRAVLLIWPDPPQAAGAGTFGADILERAGASNVITRPGWPVLSPEFLITSHCDVVIYPEAPTAGSFQKAFASGVLSGMPAVRAGRTIGIDANWLLRPGPRAFDALEALSRGLREMFP